MNIFLVRGLVASAVIALGSFALFVALRAPGAAPGVGLPEGPFAAGQPVSLAFSFADAQGEPLALSISHERSLHAVIVDDGFRSFGHVHPEDTGAVEAQQLAAGKLSVPYAFPAAGEYLVAVDYATAAGSFAETFRRTVTGPPPSQAPVAADLSGVASVDGVTVLLEAPQRIVAGQEAALRFAFEKDGVILTDLQPYLGAGAHLAVIREDLGEFVHAHGMPAALPGHDGHHGGHAVLPALFAGPLESSVAFPSPGRYRLFVEFSRGGQAAVVRFAVDVAE